jgi:hypothetical protein
MNAVILYALINYIYFFLNGETVEMHVYLNFLGGTLFIDCLVTINQYERTLSWFNLRMSDQKRLQ